MVMAARCSTLMYVDKAGGCRGGGDHWVRRFVGRRKRIKETAGQVDNLKSCG